MSANKHEQPQDTQHWDVEVQVNRKMLLDSGGYMGKTWKQYEIQDRGLSI